MHLSNEEIISKVNRILKENLGVDDSQIVPDANFADDLGCDSLDMIELTMAFEEEFGVEIPDADAEEAETVQKVYDMLSRKLAA